jgi:benzoate/toluate 1,2-dioxygenase alpha subunit
MLETIRQRLEGAVEDNVEQGRYRVARDIFTDPEIFELEMKYIFEGNWIYLAHESQIPTRMTTLRLI